MQTKHYTEKANT